MIDKSGIHNSIQASARPIVSYFVRLRPYPNSNIPIDIPPVSGPKRYKRPIKNEISDIDILNIRQRQLS
jgi:hypothetical protein